MSRRLVLAGAALVVALAAVVAVLAVRSDDDGAARAPAVTTVPLDSPVVLDANRDEALALIRKAEGRTYHARYEAAAGAGEAFPRSVEVWRRPEAARTDTEFSAGGQIERSATVRRPTEVVSCHRAAEEPWSCEKADVAVPGNLFDQATADLAGSEVAARDDDVRGRKGRCFTIQGDEVLELCFDGHGVLLRLAAGDAALELVSLDTAVDAATVKPPTSDR